MSALQEILRTVVVVLSPIWLACLAGAIGWVIRKALWWRRLWKEAEREAG